MSLIEVRNATFAYERENVFENIDLDVRKGEILCLFGPNGCGKTTFLDCLLRILKLKSGQIVLEGKNIDHFKSYEIARHIAYVPQMHEITFPYKIIDIVLMGRAAYTPTFSTPSMEDVAIAEKALEIVGMDKLKDRRYTQISGGQGQMVMIARALAQKTPIMLMDEPTAHLDFKHELTVMETIVKLVKDKALSVIMATHFPNHAFYFENNDIPTRVALMNKGEFAAIGHPGEVLTVENMKRIFNINSEVISHLTAAGNELKHIIAINTLGK